MSKSILICQNTQTKPNGTTRSREVPIMAGGFSKRKLRYEMQSFDSNLFATTTLVFKLHASWNNVPWSQMYHNLINYSIKS